MRWSDRCAYGTTCDRLEALRTVDGSPVHGAPQAIQADNADYDSCRRRHDGFMIPRGFDGPAPGAVCFHEHVGPIPTQPGHPTGMNPLELARAGYFARPQDDDPSLSFRGRSALIPDADIARLFERFSQIGLQYHLIKPPTLLPPRIEDFRRSREEYVRTAIGEVLAQLEEDPRLAASSHNRNQGTRGREEGADGIAESHGALEAVHDRGPDI